MPRVASAGIAKRNQLDDRRHLCRRLVLACRIESRSRILQISNLEISTPPSNFPPASAHIPPGITPSLGHAAPPSLLVAPASPSTMV